jgi:hypothetical protein
MDAAEQPDAAGCSTDVEAWSVDDELTKVHVDLPNHWATGGESLWARPLGGDLYELDNVPFYAYGLNYRDVVRATSDSPDLKPEVCEVVRPSGHATIRVSFGKHVPEERMLERLASLKSLATSFERATERYFALDLEPEANIAQVRAALDTWEQSGEADYETCEARVTGSFDDQPEGDHEAP